MIYSKFPFKPDLTFKGNTCLLVWKIAAGSFLMKSDMKKVTQSRSFICYKWFYTHGNVFLRTGGESMFQFILFCPLQRT